MRGVYLALTGLLLLSLGHAQRQQQPFVSPKDLQPQEHHVLNTGAYLPRINYTRVDESDAPDAPPEEMTLYSLHASGEDKERYDLTFFSDGYTHEEEAKFIGDVAKLIGDILSEGGPMHHVAHLLNILAAFVPSNMSGIGTHDQALEGAAFGLYRPGAELRGVYVKHHKRARAACRELREMPEGGGCDQPIILGNDPLYGGLGGEFTVITGSRLNGPLVLRHELGHSLIDVGEEYEGGEVYSGVNADKATHLGNLKWKDFLSDPDNVRLEDAKVPLQAYPWYNLSQGPWTATFTSFNLFPDGERLYPTAMIRLSLSSIPYPDHIEFLLNNVPIDLKIAFLPEWEGSLDRRWLEIDLLNGLPAGESSVVVRLTEKGAKAIEGQGGKMLTSVEFIEYGGQGRFNSTAGHVGAYPTYSIHGEMSLRPTNEGCLMRNVLTPTFCPVCKQGLEDALKRKIKAKST